MSKHRPHHVNPSLDTARVVFVYKDWAGHAGLSHVGLGVIAACTQKTLRRNGIWAEVWACKSGHDLKARIEAAEARACERSELGPTHVVICAPWIPTPEIVAMAAALPEVTFTIVSHSNVAFLAADPSGIRLLRETADLQHTTHNVRVAGVNRKFTEWATRAWGVNVAWLPNLYDLSEAAVPCRRWWPGDTVRLGLFGASRILKNGLTAAAAAVDLANSLRVPTELHISQEGESSPQFGVIEELVHGSPNVKLFRAGWLAWPQFRRLVRHMHVLLQPSFTESFNVVTADGIAEGVPSVVSDAIDWVPRRWQARADDPRDVAKVAMHLLHDPEAAEDGRASLDEYVRAGLARWREFLLDSTVHATAPAQSSA